MMNGDRVISVVVADDHPAVLHGLVEVLKSNSDIDVLAACGNGVDALNAVHQLTPGVAILDISMPGLSGIDVLAQLSGKGIARTKVVMLTAAASVAQLVTAINLGAKGILFKEAALDELLECVRAVAGGSEWLPSDLSDAAREREQRYDSQSLTRRERQITSLIVEGLSNKQVSHELGLSEGTVKIHLHNIYKKVGVDNRTALARMAIEHGADSPCNLPTSTARIHSLLWATATA